MSILRTHNLQNPDSPSINIVMDQGGNTNITGVTTVGSNFHVTDGISRIGALTEYGTKTVSSKGLIISSSGENTLKLIDTTSYATNVGASILLGGQYRASGDAQEFVKLKSFKENSTNGNYAYGFSVSTNANGGVVTERLRIDSSGRVTSFNGGSNQASEFNAGANQFVITHNDNCGLTIDSTSSTSGSIHFADGPTGNESYRGIVEYDHSVDSMILYTSATEKLRITSGGNIGIDCTPNDHNSFTRALDINGPSGAAVYMRTNDSTSNCFIVGNYGSEAYINNVANGNLRFYTQGTERLRITSAGSVGIGTNNPADKLSIYAPPNSLVFGAKDTTRGNHIFQLLADDSAGNGELRLYQNSASGTHLKTVEIASSGNSYLTAGNFGVGTATPGSKLTVYETGGNAKLLLQRANTANNTDDYGSVLWRSMGGTAVGAINVARATAENDGYMFFQTTSGGTMSEMMRIQPSGYIGIGEVAPGGRLTVRHANTATSGLNATLKLKQGVATNGNRSSLIFSSLDDFDVAAVNGVVDTHSGTAANNVGHLEFWTKESGNAAAQERMRVHPTGQVSINSNGWMGRFHIQQDAITEPALSIRHHDASLYKHMGTVGPADRNGNDSSAAGQYLHVRVRTVWNDSSMTMFRITGYYPYSDYTHSFVGMYRYGHNSYRTNPYGQTVHNLKRATIHSIYNEAASPGYLVFVCDWGTNYNGLMFEHIGAGSVYGSYMQNDIEIIDSLRSTGTSALTF